jgi:hypothetical protein
MSSSRSLSSNPAGARNIPLEALFPDVFGEKCRKQESNWSGFACGVPANRRLDDSAMSDQAEIGSLIR